MSSRPNERSEKSEVAIRMVWEQAPAHVEIEIYNRGRILCAARARKSRRILPEQGANDGMIVRVTDANVGIGAHATVIGVRAQERSFSLFLRDALDARQPVFIPEYGVAVTAANDHRSYDKIAADIRAKRLVGDYQRFDRQPEETWEGAAAKNDYQPCPSWLGLGRDCRIFLLKTSRRSVFINMCVNGSNTKESVYFQMGNGSDCRGRLADARSLDDQCLPILRSVMKEDRIEYRVCAFASLLAGPLDEMPVLGSDYRCSAPSGMGTPTDSFATDTEKLDLIKKETVKRADKVICVIRVEAVNISGVPSYAWFRAPLLGQPGHKDKSCKFRNGFSLAKRGRVYAAHLLNGEPMPQQEVAVLIPPGESMRWDVIIPNPDLPMKRAADLMAVEFPTHLRGAREYWRKKLDAAGKITVPEHPLNDIIKANLLNLELATLGREPDAPMAAKVGSYPPIGTESAPIIQYWDSVGRSDLAERALEFFLVRQWPDGFMQTFGHYMSETGAVLWTIGEHFRYTGNRKWLKRVTPNIIKACEQQLNWRRKNQTEDCRKKGYYGMIAGKVADDNHPFHSFFLNSGCYVGLKRSAEILRHTAPAFAEELAREVEMFRNDIRAAFFRTAAKAMVVPCGDGSWAPWIPAWSEHRGATCLYADGGNCFSHGSFLTTDWLVGPLWLVFQEVLDPDEPIVTLMLKACEYPVTTDQAALTQPYYSRHDYAHLRHRNVKPFLKAYYNQLTGLMDRETFTFWEHYWGNGAGINKTHEAAWFLMQTRWMLYVEEGDCLSLFSMAPRRWFEHGKVIRLDNLCSYFGKFSLKVVSKIKTGRIVCDLVFHDKKRLPATLNIRIPHPEGKKAVTSSAGMYDAATETVRLDSCPCRMRLELIY